MQESPGVELKKLLYTYREAAALLSLKIPAIQRLAAAGELEVVYVTAREPRVTAQSMLDYLHRAAKGRRKRRGAQPLITASSWRGK